MIACDASALIAWLDSTDALHTRALQTLLETAAEDLGASTLTLAEALVGPARSGRLEQARLALRELGVGEIPLAGAAERLATLRAETALKLPDCCVLAAAERAGASGVLTFDSRVATQARGLGLEVLPSSN